MRIAWELIVGAAWGVAGALLGRLCVWCVRKRDQCEAAGVLMVIVAFALGCLFGWRAS